MPAEKRVDIRVWDLPARLFHWIVALLFLLQVVTGKIGGALMTWHALTGYAILALVIFRVIWGFAGGTYSRFSSFVAGPRAAMRFAARLFSREDSATVGHNPLGGWSILAMLALLALQATLGFFANDGVAFEGPMMGRVSLDVSNRLTHLHRWNAYALIVLAALHVAAVIYHGVVKKERLVRAMVSGTKSVPESLAATAPGDGAPMPWRAAASLALAASIVVAIVTLGPA